MSSFFRGFLLILSFVKSEIPASEKQVLLDIYSTTNGIYWSNNKYWNTTENPCTWYGIKCDTESTHVIQLLLQANNLTGYLPDSIGNLTDVQVLSLDIPPNALTGTLPASIGQLKMLSVFTIASQHLYGSIPESIGDCSSLSILHFGGNRFTSIPDSINKLGPMSSFAIEDNNMNGVTLPDEGPELIGNNDCDLSGNVFECPIPKWAEADFCRATCR